MSSSFFSSSNNNSLINKFAGSQNLVEPLNYPTIYGPGSYTYNVLVTGLYTIRAWGAGGCGGSDVNFFFWGGTAGAFSKKLVTLTAGQTIPISVAAASNPIYYTNNQITLVPTVVSLSSIGLIDITAQSGLNGVIYYNYVQELNYQAKAYGGDINLSGGIGGGPIDNGVTYSYFAQNGQGQFSGIPGSNSTTSLGGGGGGSAPGDSKYRGGNGGNASVVNTIWAQPGTTPGGGGGASHSGSNTAYGGQGGNGRVIISLERM